MGTPMTGAGVVRIDTDEAAVALAAELQRDGRARPAVVVTTAAGAVEPYVDVDAVIDDVGGLCDVYVIPTGHVSWAFSQGLPEGRQVYGGASRVYSVDLVWLRDMRASPLRFAYGVRDRDRVTRQLIGDAMAAAHAQGLLTPPRTASVRPAEGTAMGVVGGRCLVTLSDGGTATVWPELVAPDVAAERIFVPGMALRGRLDGGTRMLDVSEMTQEADPLRGLTVGDRVLGLVERVARDTTAVAVVPGTSLNLAPFDVGGDASADLRTVLSVGEVVGLELTEVSDVRRRARIVSDVDLAELTAASILPGGPPWLVPPEPLPPDEVGEDAVPEAAPPEEMTSSGDVVVDAVTAENHQLRRRLEGLETKLARRTRERDDAKAAARTARERAAATGRRLAAEHGDRLPVGQLFRDPADTFRYRVRHAWVTRTTADDKESFPWREPVLGEGFLQSLLEIEGIEDARVAEVAADVACGRADRMAVYETHQLRTGPGGEDPPVTRERGETCWRVALQRNTPSARRLHFWRCADGSIELSSVRLHDDFRP